MIDLKTVGHSANSTTVVLKHVCEEANLVPSLDKALGNLVDVSFNTSELREDEVTCQQYIILLITRSLTRHLIEQVKIELIS